MKKSRFVIFATIIALLFCSGFCVSAAQIDSFAEYSSTKPSIVIGDSAYEPSHNNEILVPVSIENNPGFWGMELHFKYDTELLTPFIDTNGSLIVTRGDIFANIDEVWGGFVNRETGEITILIDGNSLSANNTKNGVMFFMNFAKNDAMAQGDKAIIEFSEPESFLAVDVSGNEVAFTSFKNGSVIFPIFADANDDGVVNTKDVLMIRRRLAGYSVTLNNINSDVNFDGVVNTKDLLSIRKRLAGYSVYPWSSLL